MFSQIFLVILIKEAKIVKELLSYYPIVFVLFFAVFLIVISVRYFYEVHKRDKYIRKIQNLDRYMGIQTGNVSEQDIVDVLKNYDFQYKGVTDRS
jgi:hypothetical protein